MNNQSSPACRPCRRGANRRWVGSALLAGATYGSANATTSLLATIAMYCLPFTA